MDVDEDAEIELGDIATAAFGNDEGSEEEEDNEEGEETEEWCVIVVSGKEGSDGEEDIEGDENEPDTPKKPKRCYRKQDRKKEVNYVVSELLFPPQPLEATIIQKELGAHNYKPITAFGNILVKILSVCLEIEKSEWTNLKQLIYCMCGCDR
jgi:hypothetical protein